MNTYHTFYYHISAGALAHIYVAGCIRPTSLIERREVDIQNQFPNHLLFSTKKWSTQNDCSLKVILKNDEYERLVLLSEEYYLFDSILPVSRVERIYFSDTERAKTILWNIRNGAAFLPERIIEYSSKKPGEIAKKKQLGSNIINSELGDIEILSKKFNRLLGGVAFLRTALDNYTDSSLNYPEDYIPTISYFNNYIKSEFENLNISKEFKLHSYFQKDKEDVVRYLGKDINDDIIRNVSIYENIRVNKKLGVFVLDQIPPNTLTYLLCILNIYGNNRTKSIDDFIYDIIKQKSIRGVELALLLGIHTGYEALRNAYKISGKQVDVKFEFEIKLDYYVVESIFEYVCGKNTGSDKFEYIDSMFMESQNVIVKQGYINYNILGSNIVIKKKDYRGYLYKIVNNIANDLCLTLNSKYVSIDKQKLIDDLVANNTNIFNEILSEINLETSSIINKDYSSKEKLINLKESSVVVKKSNDNKDNIVNVKSEAIIIDNALFKEELAEVAKVKELINKDKSIKMLKEVAANNNIVVPKNIQKKDEIINYLLSRIK